MVDYGTGSFTLANLGNPATGPDDVFQCNPGDSGHRNPGESICLLQFEQCRARSPGVRGRRGRRGPSIDRVTSILEFAVENHPNNPAARPGSSISHYEGIVSRNSLAFNEPVWISGRPGASNLLDGGTGNAALDPFMSQVGPDTVIALNGADILTLKNINEGTLVGNDFLFV